MNFRHYNTDPLSLEIIIKGTNINAVQGTDFLGLTLDEHLNWKSHIEKTNNKISSFCYALSVLSDVSSIKVARSAYYGNIYSLLTYGIIFWGDTVNIESTFFTLIPHDFGTQNAPLLDNVELIKKKSEMLDNLLEIEIAYSLLKTDSDNTTTPIESHYLKLKAEIVPLDKSSDEFKLILEYTRNTHAATHSSYTLDIQEPFRKLHNRKLLWHGSRVTNFAGILSQGLRIAPPEAPVTGYMFGKGLYFADMVSKSANYCCTNKSNPTGLMLLCEVALGNMKECFGAENVKLPADKHSAWGVGRTEPDPAGNKTLDCGTIVPMGKPYNKQQILRFIVYDVAQVNVKYLLQMKFNHKY
ncbi:Poly [Operophtera brumata]|uniref:Poly [ADP-ribose] polymerase n=1 Tax=Operophtera brumata TaxID=104452 RepID=A0A0L7LSU0_OPEBR|nr:Poly [Operophtera brumata]